MRASISGTGNGAFDSEELRFLEETVLEAAILIDDRPNPGKMNHIARLIFEAYRDGVRERGILVRIGQIAAGG